MSRIRLTYIVQHYHRRMHLEAIIHTIDRSRFELTFILLGETLPSWAPVLDETGTPYFHVRYAGPDNVAANIAEVCELCRRLDPHIVHAHYGEILAGLMGAFLAGVPVRVYTRHHARQPPGRTLPPREQTVGMLAQAAATHIVTPDLLVSEVLLEEGAPRDKISIIHFGFSLDVYRNVPLKSVEAMREKYVPRGAGPVIGVVSRAVELKGIQCVIPAFRQVLSYYPDAVLLLVNPTGPYREAIERLLGREAAGHFAITGHEDGIEAIYKLFDVLVHVPIGPDVEAFGLVYIEALAAGVPGVVTKSGIAREVIEHGRNAWVVEFENSDAIAQGILSLLGDAELRERIVAGGYATAAGFSVERMVRGHEDLYERLLRG